MHSGENTHTLFTLKTITPFDTYTIVHTFLSDKHYKQQFTWVFWGDFWNTLKSKQAILFKCCVLQHINHFKVWSRHVACHGASMIIMYRVILFHYYCSPFFGGHAMGASMSKQQKATEGGRGQAPFRLRGVFGTPRSSNKSFLIWKIWIFKFLPVLLLAIWVSNLRDSQSSATLWFHFQFGL